MSADFGVTLQQSFNSLLSVASGDGHLERTIVE